MDNSVSLQIWKIGGNESALIFLGKTKIESFKKHSLKLDFIDFKLSQKDGYFIGFVLCCR